MTDILLMSDAIAQTAALSTLVNAADVFAKTEGVSMEALKDAVTRFKGGNDVPVEVDKLVFMARDMKNGQPTWRMGAVVEFTMKQLKAFCVGAAAAFTSVAAFELIKEVLTSWDDSDDEAKPSKQMVVDAWNKMVSVSGDDEVATVSVVEGMAKNEVTAGFWAPLCPLLWSGRGGCFYHTVYGGRFRDQQGGTQPAEEHH